MASLLTGLCCALISVQLAAGALQQYSENKVPVGYPFQAQNLQPLPPQYQFQNQYTQGARLQAHPNLVYVGGSPVLAAQKNVDVAQLARSLCDALITIQSSYNSQAARKSGAEDGNKPSEPTSTGSTEDSGDSVKDAADGSGAAQPFPQPLQPFRAACNQLYEQQLGTFFPQPVPVQGLTLRSAPAAVQASNLAALTTGADGPDVTELAQLQARFAGVQLQEALAEESLTKNSPPSAASPAKLEQLEPDAELIPGTQQPAQQTPPVPVNPGLLPGQRVYFVHPQPNLYGQNPLYNAVPGAFGPKSGVPLPGGYQKVYIVDPQSGLDANYPTQGVQGFPQPFYATQGNNQQPGIPLQFGQGGLRSRPGSILTQPGLFPGFGQPLELSYEYQPGPGTPYFPSQFVGQLRQGQVQSQTDETSPPSDVTASTVTQETGQPIEAAATDVKAGASAEKPVVATVNDSGRRRRKERKGSYES